LYSRGEEFKDGIEGEIKRGILLFNEGFYFECHEFLEEVWRKEKGKEKSFLHGLIHSAVAFYHMEYRNYEGAASYLKRGYHRLKGFEPVFLGVDVETFLADIGDYLGLIEKSGFNDNLELFKSAIPKIKLMERTMNCT
jgi:predicted metal-dependent hydrolase